MPPTALRPVHVPSWVSGLTLFAGAGLTIWASAYAKDTDVLIMEDEMRQQSINDRYRRLRLQRWQQQQELKARQDCAGDYSPPTYEGGTALV
jgi:hypothetical protein